MFMKRERERNNMQQKRINKIYRIFLGSIAKPKMNLGCKNK